jgi:hypothetical protein
MARGNSEEVLAAQRAHTIHGPVRMQNGLEKLESLVTKLVTLALIVRRIELAL